MNKKNNQTMQDVLVISSYPDRKRDIRGLNAVAWYAQQVFGASQVSPFRYHVIAEMTNKAFEKYSDHGAQIYRCWRRDTPLAFFDIFWNILQSASLRSIPVVVVEFEFHMFGPTTTTLFFPLLLLGLRLMGKTVIIEMHQVVTDLRTISSHIHISRKGSLIYLMNKGLSLFYSAVGFLANKIVVLEETLGTRLNGLVPNSKIVLSYIPVKLVKSNKKVSSQIVKKKLGIPSDAFVIMSFGFIAWYKGTDWLVDAVIKMSKKYPSLYLLIAGGKSMTLEGQEHYEKYVADIEKKVSMVPNIKITGFIEKSKIDGYYASSNLAVLPYRVMMSSSGPLNHALSAHVPFVMSENLKNYTESNDFMVAQKTVNLKDTDIFFKHKQASFEKMISRAMSDNSYLENLSAYVKSVAKERSLYNLPLVSLLQSIYAQLPIQKLAYMPTVAHNVRTILD